MTKPDLAAGENSHRWPEMLPDGKHLLFTIRTDQITSFDDARIAVLSLDTGRWKVVLEGGACARYVSGNLLFGRAGCLYAVPFDLKSLTVTGPRRKVIDGVVTMPSSGAAHFAVSSDGDIVYVPGGIAHGRTAIVSVDLTGHTKPVADLAQSVYEIRISPDGRKIALGIAGPMTTSGFMTSAAEPPRASVLSGERRVSRLDAGRFAHPLRGWPSTPHYDSQCRWFRRRGCALALSASVVDFFRRQVSPVSRWDTCNGIRCIAAAAHRRS